MKRPVEPADPPVDFREASQALVEWLDRAATVEQLLAMVCSCAREERLAAAAASEAAHLWPCVAGCVEYWFSRHPAKAATWIASFGETRPLPPEPSW
jgi:hypothetical protein